MRKRIVSLLGLVLAGACILVVFEPQHPPVVSAQAPTGTAGTYIVQTAGYDHVFGLQYLPDASGIILSITDNYGDSSNIYRYDFDGYCRSIDQFHQ